MRRSSRPPWGNGWCVVSKDPRCRTALRTTRRRGHARALGPRARFGPRRLRDEPGCRARRRHRPAPPRRRSAVPHSPARRVDAPGRTHVEARVVALPAQAAAMVEAGDPTCAVTILERPSPSDVGGFQPYRFTLARARALAGDRSGGGSRVLRLPGPNPGATVVDAGLRPIADDHRLERFHLFWPSAMKRTALELTLAEVKERPAA